MHAQHLHFAADKIVMDSQAKTRHDIRNALVAGVRLNADNLEELKRIDEILASDFAGGGQLGTGICASRIGIRVNPQHGEGYIAETGTIAPTYELRHLCGIPCSEP